MQEFYEFWGNSLRWKPVCRSGILYIFPCFSHSLIPCVLDINECEIRNFTCTSQQTCFNIPGEYKCLDPVRCEEPYLQINEKWVTYPQPQKQILSMKVVSEFYQTKEAAILHYNHEVCLNSCTYILLLNLPLVSFIKIINCNCLPGHQVWDDILWYIILRCM